MANVSYTTPKITAARRRQAYASLGELCDHIPGLGVDLVSIIRNADNTLAITFDGPIPQAQIDHLGLIGPIQ